MMLIERPEARPDRLAALVATLRPEATPCAPEDPAATLVVTADALVLRLTPAAPEAFGIAAARVVCAAPLADALRGAPARFVLDRAGCPALDAAAAALTAEAQAARCGGRVVAARLAEALFVLALRRAVDAGAGGGGLLAGLADPRLHRALTAVHDAPDAAWSVERLAGTAGMSRSRFTARFAQVMGETPMAYVAGWRMAQARAALAGGAPVKAAAHLAGFGSTAAFSRAWRRRHGGPPTGAARDSSGGR
jgi:transcriptional regulator GlxA family with amidase domain